MPSIPYKKMTRDGKLATFAMLLAASALTGADGGLVGVVKTALEPFDHPRVPAGEMRYKAAAEFLNDEIRTSNEKAEKERLQAIATTEGRELKDVLVDAKKGSYADGAIALNAPTPISPQRGNYWTAKLVQEIAEGLTPPSREKKFPVVYRMVDETGAREPSYASSLKAIDKAGLKSDTTHSTMVRLNELVLQMDHLTDGGVIAVCTSKELASKCEKAAYKAGCGSLSTTEMPVLGSEESVFQVLAVAPATNKASQA